MALSVENFLNKVRLKSKIPKNQVDDDEILSLADDEIKCMIVPEIISTNENYFYHEIEENYSASNTDFRNPSGSIGGGLQNLLAKKSVSSTQVYNVEKINTEDKGLYSYSYSFYGINFGFYSTAGGFSLYPSPTSTGLLVMSYLLRPGNLVTSSKTGTVAAIYEDTNQIELNQIPVEISAGTNIDIMKSDRLAERVVIDKNVEQVDTGTQRITFGEDVNFDAISVGDTVSETGTSPFFPIEDYGPKLIDLTTRKLAQIIGDSKLMKDANDSLASYAGIIQESICPRVKEEVDAIMPYW